MYGKIIIFVIILFIMLLSGIFIFFICRRRKSMKKVRQMCKQQKLLLLNELSKPFGFCYVPPNPYQGLLSNREDDIFKSRVDAWQRGKGYEALYDKAAAGAHMIFDYWRVYFNYEGRTWLIELWKGQYGISTGAEVGVYHADKIIPKEMRKITHFDAVEDGEMPYISFCLKKKQKNLFSAAEKHWWLTGFRMGEFSKPKDLSLSVKIRFDDIEQAKAFVDGVKESGKTEKYCRNCNEVYFCMDFSNHFKCGARLYRNWIQFINRILCKLYIWGTKPFETTLDRVLYLYFLLPRCFRKLFCVRPLSCKRGKLEICSKPEKKEMGKRT